jgi:hypothetical protein
VAKRAVAPFWVYVSFRGDPTAIPNLAVKMRVREWFGDLVSTLDLSAAFL